MSDQDRISPYNQPDMEMKRKKEKYQQGKKIDPKPNSLNEHSKNCMAKSKEKINKVILGERGKGKISSQPHTSSCIHI